MGERGRPPEGHFTSRTAEAALQEILTDARRGEGITEPRSIGVTFADASAEWLRYCAHELAAKRSTLLDYGSTARVLDAELGDLPLVEGDTELLAVPMADPVAKILAQLSQREHFTGDDDLVFSNHAGDHQNPKRLYGRYRAAQETAGLRPLSFHGLRHTFGALAINRADPVQVQHWMGHANLQTTMRYLHFRQRDDEADLLSEAFEPELGPEIGPQHSTTETNSAQLTVPETTQRNGCARRMMTEDAKFALGF